MKKSLLIAIASLILVVGPAGDEAFASKFLYHATRRAIAGKIELKGFSASKMKTNPRFGAGLYLSPKSATAKAEKPAADAILRMGAGRGFEKRVWNLSRPKAKDLRAISKGHGLRGAVKKNVIGPNLGHRLGTEAGRRGNVIRYHSARDSKGTNYFIPKRTYMEHPRIINGVQSKTNGRYH